MPSSNSTYKSYRHGFKTRLCEFVGRGHGCRHGKLCDHAHTYDELNIPQVLGDESGFILRWFVVGGIGKPSRDIRSRAQIRHIGCQKVHHLIRQLIGTLGCPQLRHMCGQKVHHMIRQLIGPLGGQVLGVLMKQLSVPRGRHATGIMPKRSGQAVCI